MDVLYHHTEFGVAGTSPDAGRMKSSMFFVFYLFIALLNDSV